MSSNGTQIVWNLSFYSQENHNTAFPLKAIVVWWPLYTLYSHIQRDVTFNVRLLISPASHIPILLDTAQQISNSVNSVHSTNLVLFRWLHFGFPLPICGSPREQLAQLDLDMFLSSGLAAWATRPCKCSHRGLPGKLGIQHHQQSLGSFNGVGEGGSWMSSYSQGTQGEFLEVQVRTTLC